MTQIQETKTDVVKLTIDGKEIEARPGELLIQAAQENGIFIPRFCWHERMKPVGMCRMCLVEVDGVRGLPPACTTPVAEGMNVHLQQENVQKAQDGVLEFLLINHPLDCPVCDRGGECPLQDQTLAFGPGESRFIEEKRHFEKPIPISDLVYLDRERCIQCARCTRFADEIAGDPLITFVDRGDHTQVLNFPDDPFASYFSGNTVQICPVGALTAKPYRFQARPWDLETTETSCTTCAVQCRGALQSSSNQMVRFLGVDSEPVNQGWLCDKGRFGFEWAQSAERVREPMTKQNDELQRASWPDALDAAANGLRDVIATHGPDAVGVIGGARGTNEDAYAWARFAKGVMRTDNVDAQLGDGLPAEVINGLPRALISDLDRASGIVLMAPDIKEELPVLYLRVRHAAVELGVPLIEISAHDTGLTPYATAIVTYLPGEQGVVAEKFVQAVNGQKSGEKAIDAAAALLANTQGQIVVVLGRPSLAESATPTVQAATSLRDLPNMRILSALRRANVHGALDMGLAPGLMPGRVSLEDSRMWFSNLWGGVPDHVGSDTAGMLRAARDGKLKALILLGADPLADFPDHELATAALQTVPFLVAVDCFQTESNNTANVFLPVGMWGERAGSITNIEGRVQSVAPKVTAEGTTMADWRIATELAERMSSDFDAGSESGWQDEIAESAPAYVGVDAQLLSRARDGVVVPISEFPNEITLERAPGITGVLSWEPIQPSAAMYDLEPVATQESPIPLFSWTEPAQKADIPARNTYALRLVSERKLFDNGHMVQNTPALAGLAAKPELHVSTSDREQIGVQDGVLVRVRSPRGSFDVAIQSDDKIPNGVASITFSSSSAEPSPNKPMAAKLISADALVTDIEVETLS